MPRQVSASPAGSVRVLGIDPGLTRCGMAIAELDGRRTIHLLAASCIRTPPDVHVGGRLVTLDTGLISLTERFGPQEVFIEEVFSQANLASVRGTAQAQGAIAVRVEHMGLPLTFMTPTAVKKSLTGSGKATKDQVRTMAERVAGREIPGPADVADAVAIAIVGCWRVAARPHGASQVALDSRRVTS